MALNKCDLISQPETVEELVKAFGEMGYEAFPVSAATHRGFEKLLDRVVEMLPSLPPPRVFEAVEEEEAPSLREATFTVSRQNQRFVVEGPAIQRLIDSVNFGDEESLAWFHRQLRDRGVVDALREKGAEEGSTVQMGDMEFDFVE